MEKEEFLKQSTEELIQQFNKLLQTKEFMEKRFGEVITKMGEARDYANENGPTNIFKNVEDFDKVSFVAGMHSMGMVVGELLSGQIDMIIDVLKDIRDELVSRENKELN